MTIQDHATEDATHQQCAPVQELWFDDGNLILKAENSLFKIYGGFLASRSSVFRDMLAFPPPAEGNPKYNGCHIVTVYDSAHDMALFLKAVFDSSFFEPPPTPTELHIVEGILRLSLKYDVQYLRRRALRHLLSTFPSTLPGWKQRDHNRTIPPVDNTPFAAFRVAREFDLDFLLPPILYCISSHPYEKTLDYAPWRDGEITLPWPDKRMCIVGRHKILMSQSHTALEMTKAAGSTVEGCTGESCASTRLRCAEILNGWDMAGFLDYFEDNANIYYPDFCLLCRTAFQDMCNSTTQTLWNELPAMFGLPDWEVLEKRMNSALEG